MLRPNATLYRACGCVRCWVGAARVSVAPSAPLEATLRRAAGGARADQLAAALVADDAEIARDDAEAFVAELLAHGLLVEESPAAPPPAEPPLASLDDAQLAALRDAIAILHRLHTGEDPLARFVAGFAARFGDEEVGLLVALDDEAGVGFPPGPVVDAAPLVDGLIVAPGGDRDALLVEKLAAGAGELALALDDVAHLAPAWPLPAGYTARVRLGDRLVLDEVVATAPPPTDPPLPLDDLTLALEYERLTLRSRRLGREVHPPVDARDPTPVARLLRALPHQGVARRLAFAWGALAARSLPTVTAAGVVISAPSSPALGPSLQVGFGTPRSRPRGRRPSLHVPRTFSPGSEWLQLGLYGAETALDALLVELVAPLVARARHDGAVARWHFFRYRDPQPHLRVRLHGPHLLELLPEFERTAAPFRSDGRLARWELAAYVRELGRYGGSDGIVVAERMFEHDSDAVAELVGLLDPDAGAEARWRLALLGLDALVEDLGVDPLAAVAAAQAEHFAVGASLAPQLAARFASLADELAMLRTRPADHELAPGFEVLGRRSAALAPLVAELRGHDDAGRLSRSIAEQAPSYLHMFVNRLLRSASLEQERVLYEFLRRLHLRG